MPSTFYVTSEKPAQPRPRALEMLTEDFDHIGAEDLLRLHRAWELQHRILTAESVARHTLFRQETRWPGYYYRADPPKRDDADWQVFAGSRFDPKTGAWTMSKLSVDRIVEGFELLRT